MSCKFQCWIETSSTLPICHFNDDDNELVCSSTYAMQMLKFYGNLSILTCMKLFLILIRSANKRKFQIVAHFGAEHFTFEFLTSFRLRWKYQNFSLKECRHEWQIRSNDRSEILLNWNLYLERTFAHRSDKI